MPAGISPPFPCDSASTLIATCNHSHRKTPNTAEIHTHRCAETHKCTRVHTHMGIYAMWPCSQVATCAHVGCIYVHKGTQMYMQAHPGTALPKDAVCLCAHIPKCMHLLLSQRPSKKKSALKQDEKNVIKGPFTKVRAE